MRLRRWFIAGGGFRRQASLQVDEAEAGGWGRGEVEGKRVWVYYAQPLPEADGGGRYLG